MKTPAFIKNIGAALSPIAASVKATVGKQVEKFEAFKDRNPKFKRVWNVLTHPTTTRILGIAVAVALAPLTGGFTLPLAVSLSLSCAVIFSTTLFMGIQRYRLEKAKARLKVVKDIGAARSTIAELAQKPGLDKRVEALKDERPELADLLAPKPTELPEKQSRRVTLTVAESLYYEGLVCLSVMTACFGVAGVAGVFSAVLPGVSGFVGHTTKRLNVTQKVYSTQDERRYESEKEGLGDLSPEGEREKLIQARALTAALEAVAQDSKLSLPEVYDEQLGALKSRSLPSPPGVMRCVLDEFNPFRAEPPKQEPEPAAHAPTANKKGAPDDRLKPGPTPHVDRAKSKTSKPEVP